MEKTLERKVLGLVDPDRVLDLEQASIRIPSPTFEEGPYADYLAKVMKEIGLEVEMVSVPAPGGRTTRQPVGRWRGNGGGPSLMLNGHMDHNPVIGTWSFDPFCGDFKDGWVLGRGSQDEKAGIVSSLHAVEVLMKAGVRLKGDLIITPVAGHKAGGEGVKQMLRQGIVADYCINTENSGLGIANINCGLVKWRVIAKAKPVHFHTPARVKGPHYMQPAEQLQIFMQALGRPYSRVAPGGWLSYTPHPGLPEYPQLSCDAMQYTRFSGQATADLQTRLVPGQSPATVRADAERLYEGLKAEHLGLDLTFEVPYEGGSDVPAFAEPEDSPLVQALVHAHETVLGQRPVVGAEPRIGAVGDGNFLAAAGIKTVLYGPGDIDIFDQWPTPDERVLLEDVVAGAKVYALAAVEICGLA